MKTGTINVSGGTSAAVKAVAQSDPLVSSLASLAVQALKANPVASGAVVALNARTVQVIPAADMDGIPAGFAAAGLALSGNLSFDGGAKNNAPMTNAAVAGLFAELNAVLTEEAKPSFSVQSAIGKIEDVLAEEGVSGIIIVDQLNNVIKVYTGPPGNVDTAEGGLPAAADTIATFEQTVEAATGPRDFGE